MKTMLTSIALCILACQLRAQVSFTLSSTPYPGAYPQGVAAADVNGDGKLELISANSNDNTLSVLTNNGSGGFAVARTYAVGNHPYSVVAVDVNGDGKVDLISANQNDNTLTVMTNDGSGGFVLASSPGVGTTPYGITAADLNGDGKVDLICANSGANTLSILTNNSSGNFVLASAPSVGNAPVSVAAADINGDGKLELISANANDNSLSVLTNNGSGGFGLAHTYAVGNDPRTVVAADVNGDGKLDLISANYNDNTLTILTNNGSGGFGLASSPGVGRGTFGLVAADVNGDGKVDLISANVNDGTLSVLTNNGSGSFVLALSPSVGSGPECVVAADVNGDGKLDLISANAYGSSLSVLTNATPFPQDTPSCDPAPTGLVSWWPGEGNANDIVGGNNGVPTGGITYAAGKVGQAFVFNGSTSYIPVPASPSLDIGATGSGITIECWINPASAAENAPMVEWDSPSTDGLQFWVQQPLWLYANIEDTGGHGHLIYSSNGVVATNVWQHAALTYDKVSGAAVIYLNGNVVATNNLGSFTPQTTYPLNIGRRTGQPIGLDDTFNGGIDELGLYNRALSAVEITAIYNAGSAGKCPLALVSPTITTQPAAQTVTVGNMATFSVVAVGTAPLSYQWSFNTTNIVGATNTTLTLNNVQFTQAGNYTVLVANSAGATNSIAAMLTVNPPPSCDPAPSGLVSWWPAEGNANDIVGGNNGVPTGGITYTNGEVGQTFVFNGSTSYIPVPTSPSLDIGATGSGITIEGWIKPNQLGPVGAAGLPIVEWDSASNDGLQLWVNAGFTLFANIKDTGNNSHAIQSAQNSITTNSFQHVVLTYDKGSGAALLYINGAMVVSNNIGTVTPLTTQPTYPLNIGRRTGQPVGNGSTFNGLIDELSLYNRALSAGEIAAIYNAASAGKCAITSPVVPAVPIISSFEPASGTNGMLVTISGTNFSATASANLVFFGAVQAAVLSASPTNLVVMVPTGATFAPVTVTVNGLTAYASQSFLPTFAGTGQAFSSATFGPSQNLAARSGPVKVVIADLDGDGKPDLAVANTYDHSISIYRNISVSGSLTAASFAPPVVLATPTGSQSPYYLAVADLDGDGKLDIIASDFGDNLISIYRNVSTPGSLTTNSFAPRMDLATGAIPIGIAVGDLDGDGKPEIVVGNFGGTTISIFRNISTIGNIAFVPRIDLTTPASPASVAIGDLDGDGKPDLAVADYSGYISLFRNHSTPGNISSNTFDARVDLPAQNQSLFLAIGDLDGDGKPELIASAYAPQTMSVYHNLSTPGSLTVGSFAAPVNYGLAGRGHSIALADINGDGKLDIAEVTELSSALSLFQNVGMGSFTSTSLATRVDFATGYNAWGVAVGDLNGDGRPDVVFCNAYDSTIQIYQNETPLGIAPVITAQPTNQLVTVGDSVTFSVTASGTMPLSYQWSVNTTNINDATNATLTLNNVQLSDAGYYSVTVTNPYGSAASSKALLKVNQPPVADATATAPLVISVNNSNATVVLNGSLSHDPDGDSLQYTWYQTGSSNPLATGIIAVVVLPVGTNSITLFVSDGLASSQQTITVQVVTLAQAVQQLQAAVLADVSKAQPLIATLNAALGSIDRSNPTAAINQLQAFQNKVSAQISPLNPALAQTLIDEAQNIINALSGAASHTPIRAWKQSDGKMHLNFSGIHQQIYIIEASTDLVNWQMIGVAQDQGDGTFNFDDVPSTQLPTRYYRVAIP